MPSDDIAPMSAHGAGEWGDGDKKLGLAGESGASITASRRIRATATTTRGTEVFSEAAKYGCLWTINRQTRSCYGCHHPRMDAVIANNVNHHLHVWLPGPAPCYRCLHYHADTSYIVHIVTAPHIVVAIDTELQIFVYIKTTESGFRIYFACILKSFLPRDRS